MCQSFWNHVLLFCMPLKLGCLRIKRNDMCVCVCVCVCVCACARAHAKHLVECLMSNGLSTNMSVSGHFWEKWVDFSDAENECYGEHNMTVFFILEKGASWLSKSPGFRGRGSQLDSLLCHSRWELGRVIYLYNSQVFCLYMHLTLLKCKVFIDMNSIFMGSNSIISQEEL